MVLLNFMIYLDVVIFKDLRHCYAMLGGNGAVPPQMKNLNIFCVRPPITLQMFVVMLQDYTGPTKKD